MKLIIGIIIGVVFLLAGCSSDEAFEYSAASEMAAETTAEQVEEPAQQIEETAERKEDQTGSVSSGTVFVYVCGAVNEPGVYELPEGSRIYQAVEAAGGLTSEADIRSLNQAQLLSDGEQITVYTQEEVSASGVSGIQVSDADDGLVNINQADVSELTSLPGIGTAKAEAIIAYREEHGLFGSPEDICNVTGIKEKLYESISSLITV